MSTREIVLSTRLAAPIETIWAQVRRSAVLRWVSRGRLGFVPIDPPELPETWAEGEYLVALRAFGVLPLGRQVIGIEFPDAPPPARVARDNGRGTFVRVWDHRIELAPDGPDATLYTDRLFLDAGPLTPLVALIARDFYAHRQRRWRKLVANGFDTERPG